tara:strand:+ start:119312 stop:119500 length:189 start_codon:yes stop_codon:yes gene_type:complete
VPQIMMARSALPSASGGTSNTESAVSAEQSSHCCWQRCNSVDSVLIDNAFGKCGRIMPKNTP